MKIFFRIILFLLAVNVLYACGLKLWPEVDDHSDKKDMYIHRYDMLQSRYLTTGDFSALQKMNTTYPIETRTLIENVLQLGTVNEPEINKVFLQYFQDSTLQKIIADVEKEYEEMDDINTALSESFVRLSKVIPNMRVPMVYTQIGALNQSIVIGDNTIGISLDKYLGKDYSVYKRFYPESQRNQMDRKNIVPDCLLFYMLSLYPLNNIEERSQKERDIHVARIMWVANKMMRSQFYNNKDVHDVETLMREEHLSIHDLLSFDNNL